MAGELATLAAETAPFVTAYGAAVLAKTKDDLADETVGLGKRLLQLIFRRKKEDEQLPDIVVEAVENPDDNAVRGMLEYTIRKALENDAQMLAEVREILAEAGPRAKITQNVRAGRNAYVVGQGNMNITRTTDLAGATRWPLNRPADLRRGSKSHLLGLAEAATTRSPRSAGVRARAANAPGMRPVRARKNLEKFAGSSNPARRAHSATVMPVRTSSLWPRALPGHG